MLLSVKPRGSERLGGCALLLEAESEIANLSRVDQGYQGSKFSTAVEKLAQAKVELSSSRFLKCGELKNWNKHLYLFLTLRIS